MFKRLRRWLSGRFGPPSLPELLDSSVRMLSHRFTAAGIDHALIGGVAVSLHGPPRSTQDIDFLIDSVKADHADAIMLELGFETLQRTTIFANYLLKPLRVDFLHTQGSRTSKMLARAVLIDLDKQRLKVVTPEDLIGLKLQALSNVENRKHDQADIQTLMERFHATMDLTLVREYFVLFNKEHELDAILQTLRGRPR